MGALADALAGKTAGDLIRADDWNDLITAIEEIEARLTEDINDLSTSVDTRFEAVDTRFEVVDTAIDAVDDRVDIVQANVAALTTQVTALNATVAALRQQFRRVTLRTTRANVALGDVVEITGRITDLEGNPLVLTNAATRPWIDFVTVWGQLKPAMSPSIGSAGDRAISVRVDAQGEARVLLRAEQVQGVTDTEEQSVISALSTVIPANGFSVSQNILDSATPMEARERGAFRLLTAEYTRTDAPGIRNYADAYYIRNPDLVNNHFMPGLHQQWRDYRATVMAFAKSDSDPLTADSSLGSCSIQVNFRDWVAPWVILDFLPETEILIPSFETRFGNRITNDYLESLVNVREEVEEILGGKGLIGKLRDYTAIEAAIGQMEVSNPPIFITELTETLHNGIIIQHATEIGQTLALGLNGDPTAFNAISGTGAKADRQGPRVTEQLTGYVDQQLGTAQQQLSFQVQQQQAAFRNELFAEDGMIQNVNRNLNVMTGQVSGFQQALNAKADVQVLARFLPG